MLCPLDGGGVGSEGGRLGRQVGAVRVTMVAAALLLALVGAGSPRAARAVMVCPRGCAFSEIAPALAAASSGDTILVAPGAYEGGFTIDKSVSLVGAGASKTVISGGGPVVTVGVYLGESEPTVSVSGVTVSGGVTAASPDDPSVALAGGVWVPRSAAGTGATVTIANSVITGNRVQARQSNSCGPGCTVAFTGGGGIENGGTLTLDQTTVSSNTAASDTSLTATLAFAVGGGIFDGTLGTLVLHDSTVVGNHVFLAANSGYREGDGGGISSDGPLSIDGSLISGNVVTIVSSAAGTPPQGGAGGEGGGIHLYGPATITNSTISGNSFNVANSADFAGAAAGGIDDDGSLVLANSTVSGNSAAATGSSPLTSASIFADAGGMEVDGAVTIKNDSFVGNSTSAASPAGSGTSAVGGALVLTSPRPMTISNSLFKNNTALATTTSGSGSNAGGGAIFTLGTVAISNSVIAGNTAVAVTSSGNVLAQGGGILNDGALTLTDTQVTSNTATAHGPSGSAQGGGIWSGDIGNGQPQLALTRTTISHNSVTGDTGISVQGGGLYTDSPIILVNSQITNDTPDDCAGEGC
jgi:hypothetical protein